MRRRSLLLGLLGLGRRRRSSLLGIVLERGRAERDLTHNRLDLGLVHDGQEPARNIGEGLAVVGVKELGVAGNEMARNRDVGESDALADEERLVQKLNVERDQSARERLLGQLLIVLVVGLQRERAREA